MFSVFFTSKNTHAECFKTFSKFSDRGQVQNITHNMCNIFFENADQRSQPMQQQQNSNNNLLLFCFYFILYDKTYLQLSCTTQKFQSVKLYCSARLHIAR